MCDPMYGPAVRRKRFHRSVGFAVLHQCIRPRIGAVWCSGPSWISARVRSHYRTGLERGPFGSPVFACAGKTGPPFRFILSQTSAGKRDYVIALSLISVSSFVRAVRPFLVPACMLCGIARRGRQRLAVALGSALAPAFAGHALTGPSTVPRSHRPGRRRGCPRDFEVALLVENRPGDAGQLIGERDRQHVVVQSLLGRFQA